MLDFCNIKTLTVKVGTSTLTHKNGTLYIKKLESLVRVLSDIKNSGINVVLVTSGAVGVGMTKLGLKQRPKAVQQKQAAAAVGQCSLMAIYDKLFSEYSHLVAQVLLTRDVIENDIRNQNVVNTFKTLFEFGVIPIVNENDTVSVEEIELEFGDNDNLSAIVACISNSQLLINLSDVDGLYDYNPKQNKNAKLINEVAKIDEHIMQISGGVGSEFATGGMYSKILAAKIVTQKGIPMVIANGENPNIIFDILENKPVGTLFVPINN